MRKYNPQKIHEFTPQHYNPHLILGYDKSFYLSNTIEENIFTNSHGHMNPPVYDKIAIISEVFLHFYNRNTA